MLTDNKNSIVPDVAMLFKIKIRSAFLSSMWLKAAPLLFMMTLLVCESAAQNLENIGKGEAFSMSGGISANSVFYEANGLEGRRDPFNYFLSGNLNISIYDWSIPLSFSYSDQNSAFQQPFNQYGLSPTYKWITLHAGYRSMNFSDYTVNGHLFLGGGFDITQKEKLKISAFYGRLQKAVEEDTTNVNNLPAYKRMGGGIKVTVGDQKNFVDVIAFKAKDDITSLESAPVVEDVKPEENLVVGLNFGTVLFEKLTFKGEVSSSAFTRDLRAETVGSGKIYDSFDFAFKSRTSSSYYNAYKSTLQYSMKNVGLGFAYERIDPGYRTLGAYYFNNNLESFSLTSTAILFQKKVRANARVGVQRNNLDKTQLNTMNRLSGSLNVNYQASERLMFNASYSNFQTVINFRSQFDYINQVSPYENLDTLNYRQISQNANVNMNYVLNNSKEKKQNLNVNLAYQNTADEQANIEQPTGLNFYNFNSSYSIVFTESNLTLNVAVNGNLTKSIDLENKIFGPSASVRKSFFDKKLSANTTVSYNNSYQNGDLSSRVVNLRLSGNYTLKEQHQFNLNLTQINRFSPNNEAQKHFTELTIQLGYNYNFSL